MRKLAAIAVSALFLAHAAFAAEKIYNIDGDVKVKMNTDKTDIKQPLPKNAKIYGATVHTSFLLYAFAPEMLAGWGYPIRDYESKYMPERYRMLPVLGCWSGGGSPDKDALSKVKPDIAFTYGQTGSESVKRMETYLKEFGMPLITVDVKSLRDYPAVFKSLGTVFGKEEKAAAMSAYAENALKNTEKIWTNVHADKRPSIFMAGGKNGLRTVCGNSQSFEIISLAGGRNAYECNEKSGEHSGPSLTMEQLTSLNPDFIVTENKEFYKNAVNNPEWKKLRAVKDGRFILIPDEPFRWNMHGLYTGLLGIQYFSCAFYPDKCDIDMKKEAAKFMKVFFDTDIDEKTAEDILTPDI